MFFTHHELSLEFTFELGTYLPVSAWSGLCWIDALCLDVWLEWKVTSWLIQIISSKIWSISMLVGSVDVDYLDQNSQVEVASLSCSLISSLLGSSFSLCPLLSPTLSLSLVALSPSGAAKTEAAQNLWLQENRFYTILREFVTTFFLVSLNRDLLMSIPKTEKEKKGRCSIWVHVSGSTGSKNQMQVLVMSVCLLCWLLNIDCKYQLDMPTPPPSCTK